RLLQLVQEAGGLNGFRFFPGHDERVLPMLLQDRRCAKIILRRNPLDSYVSLKIARQTGQWRMGDGRTRKVAKATFQAEEFASYRAELEAYYQALQRLLQYSGQTGFFLSFEDLRDADVVAGLGRFLGLGDADRRQLRPMLPQNPEPLSERVENPKEMIAYLADLAKTAPAAAQSYEPSRGPAVPSMVLSSEAPLLFTPIPAGPTAQITSWLAAFGPAGVRTELGRGEVDRWLQDHPHHRRFTVLRHPLRRAIAAYEALILNGTNPELQKRLREDYGVTGLVDERNAGLGDDFTRFLKFVKANLNGQTHIKVDPLLASQTVILQGIASYAMPDMLVREDRLKEDLTSLCAAIGRSCPPISAVEQPGSRHLGDLIGERHLTLCRQIYARDYRQFGFPERPANLP
ncbi:MAG: nodulation protein NodH, partial [Paracoccaceae bacterium]